MFHPGLKSFQAWVSMQRKLIRLTGKGNGFQPMHSSSIRAAEQPGTIKARAVHFFESKIMFWVLFLVLAAMSLWSVWWFPFVPSQDGPAHLYNASILANFSNSPTLQRFFELSIPTAGNMTSHVILAGFTQYVTPRVAEKMLLTILILLFPLSFYLLLRVLRGDNVYFALWGFLLVKNELYLLGFWNFVLGVAIMFLLIAYTIGTDREWRGPQLAVAAALSGLLYFTHSVPWALGVAILGFLLLLLVLDKWRQEGLAGAGSAVWSRVWALAAVVWPAALLIFYVSATNQFGTPPEVASVQAKAWHFYSGAFLGAQIGGGYPVRVAVMASLVVLSVVAEALRLRSGIRLSLGDFLLGAAVACGAGVLVLPGSIGSAGYLQNRLALLAATFLVLWFGCQRWPRLLGPMTLALAVCLTAGHEYAWARYSQAWQPVLAEVASAGAQVRDGDVLVAAIANVPPSASAGALVHAAGYWSGRDFVDLWNYEAVTNHFPVSFRSALSPVRRLSVSTEMGKVPPRFSIDGYEAATPARVSLVALIGMDGRTIEQDMPKPSWDPGDRFQLSWVSSPNGLVRFYRRKERERRTE